MAVYKSVQQLTAFKFNLSICLPLYSQGKPLMSLIDLYQTVFPLGWNSKFYQYTFQGFS